MLRGAARFLLPIATLVACASTASTPNPLVVDPLQYRDDISVDRLQLQVTNGLTEQLSLAAVQLRWDGFDSNEATIDAVIGVGQRVDLPVDLAAPHCKIDGRTVGAAPSTDDAEVVFTLADGAIRTADVVDPDGTLDAIFTATCRSAMVAEQITLEFTDVQQSTLDGRAVSIATLRLARRAATGAVTVLSSGNTIPFMLTVPGRAPDAPLVSLAADASVSQAPVQFLEGRCDAHAVAESKQSFRFVMQVRLGDDLVVPFVVEPPTSVQLGMLATAAAGCAALGLDGTLQPDG
ncbi:MAG TPA: hypothetical protein PK020_01195 [Ilumatobacteraceae bacterium]|nr:hypothetical protein [Ilumatobacteraceae bacterium]HRB03429.1 hypothetical protein [Ilumatobacteraceae bacterium]